MLEDEELAAEWLLWMDIDTVVIDANFTLPFEEFAAKSKDLVVYGNRTETEKGHPVKGRAYCYWITYAMTAAALDWSSDLLVPPSRSLFLRSGTIICNATEVTFSNHIYLPYTRLEVHAS